MQLNEFLRELRVMCLKWSYGKGSTPTSGFGERVGCQLR